MRAWPVVGTTLVSFWLAFGCGQDGKQSARGAAGAAGASLNEGGNENASAGSTASAAAPAAGGGGGEAGEPNGLTQFLPLYESGTRLRAVSLGEPGSSDRKLLSWYDSELDLRCRFKLAEDGEVRCLPIVEGGLQAGFADAACEQPVLYDGLVEPCTARPLFWLEALDEGVCSGYRVLRLTDTELTAVYHEQCGPEPLLLEPMARAYSFEPVAPALFALGRERERVGDAGFGVLELVSDDGAREVTSITSAEFGTCQVREVAEGGLRCVPHRAYLDSEWWFGGQGCTGEQLAYAVRSEDCSMSREPAMALVWPSGNYQELPGLFAIGPAVEGSVYQKSGSTCGEADAADVLWSLHPVLEAFELERVLGVAVEPQGSGRVRLAHYAATDGTLLTLEYRGSHQGQAIFHDRELGAPCFALPLESGDYLCLPDGARGRSESLYFADDACSEPVLLEPLPDSQYFAPYRDDHCSQELSSSLGLGEVYSLGDAETGDVYALTGMGECQLHAAAQDFTRLSQNDTFPRLDEEVE